MLTLYFHPRSSYSRRVRIALIEKKIAYEEAVLEMAKGEHKAPEYLALNPYGRVPTITEDGLVLYESTAILNYLEATRPTPPLVPADPKGRALVDMHMKLCDIQLGRWTSVVVFPRRFVPKEKWDVPAMDAAMVEINKHIAALETQLTGKQYLVGEQFTLADICYLTLLYFLPVMEITPPPAVAAWLDRLLTRPSALATQPDR